MARIFCVRISSMGIRKHAVDFFHRPDRRGVLAALEAAYRFLANAGPLGYFRLAQARLVSTLDQLPRDDDLQRLGRWIMALIVRRRRDRNAYFDTSPGEISRWATCRT